jgi:hypothetical protein
MNGPDDKIRVNRYDLKALERVRSAGKWVKATINLQTGEITFANDGEGASPSERGPQFIGIGGSEAKPERLFFFGNVARPLRGEVYRWHSEFDPYIFYYVQYKSWITDTKRGAHCVICPGFDFRFKEHTKLRLYVVQQSVKHPITPRLGVICDDNERQMAMGLVRLAHKAWPISTRGQMVLTDSGLVGPPTVVEWKGVDRWRVAACALWWRWQTDKVTWEARAADIREMFPNEKHPMTAERLRRECAKDRMGLLA